MPYYLGIDGGGTKTTCAVGDENQLLATATAGPSNIVRVGETQARESLLHSIRQACAASRIKPEQVLRTCVGGSGAARPELAATVQAILAEILHSPVDVVGDMEIALEAAFGAGPGVIVIAGTGSIAYGRNESGNTARAGGWGFAIGDEGSAHWIGREAIRAVLRDADDKGQIQPSPRSNLVAALLQAWKVNSLLDLARMANAVPPPDFAALFPAVASSTDDLATSILHQGGRELARIAALVAHQLFPQPGPNLVPVATTGSVFRYASLVWQVFYNEVRKFDARAQIAPHVIEPVEGALQMARRVAAKAGELK